MDALPSRVLGVMEVSLNSVLGHQNSKPAGFINKITLFEDCTACGKCKKICPFLHRYGLPQEIINSGSESVFLCTNCKACDSACPKSLNPSESLLNLKYKLITDNKLSPPTMRAVENARSFAMRGHKFPFAFYPETDMAFWPGCSLQGTRPDLVKKIIRILNAHYKKEIGLALDCCFDPVFQNGDLDVIKASSRRIIERLNQKGIKRLILGCTNCKKIFSLYMPEIETVHILEVLPDITQINEKDNKKEFYIHHPCPSFRFDFLREKFNAAGSSMFLISGENSIPTCCGLGGLSHAISEEMTNSFTEKVLAESKDKPIVTYCMGCKNRFLKKGKETYHILELVADLRPLKKPVSSMGKWFNRFILATSERLKNKKLLIGIAIVIAIILMTYLTSKGHISPETILGFIKKHRVIAPALFILFYSLSPSLFIPVLPLTVGAGFLWGPFWGVIFSITGATIGAFMPFLLSRYLFGDIIKKRFGYARWQWLTKKVEKHGWKAVAFARLLPILPFPVLNYLFGITPIPAWHYLWSTFVFMLPACIAYVVFGNSMEELIVKGNIKGLIAGILIVSVLMLIPLAFKRISKRLLSDNEQK